MLKKNIKKMINLLMVLVLGLCSIQTIFAASFSKIDWNKKGSITLTLKDTESNIVQGGKYALYHVANIIEGGYTLDFTYTDDFKDNGMELNDLNKDDLASHLASYALSRKINSYNQNGNEKGIIQWENLELGLYLVVQTKQSDNYYPIDPFLISIPLANANNDDWLYHIEASPKVEPLPISPEDKDLTVKKVWVDDGKNTPEYIEVTLYKDYQIYDVCTLSKDNHWSFTWTNLSNQYQWTIKETNVPNDYTVSYTNNEKEIIITNTSTSTQPPLIQTGQLNWPIPILAITGIALFTIGWVMTFMKKDKKNEG